MSAIKIKKGDLVKVIAGKDKDKEGKVIAVDHKKGTVTVEGANMITKHTKPSPVRIDIAVEDDRLALREPLPDPGGGIGTVSREEQLPHNVQSTCFTFT